MFFSLQNASHSAVVLGSAIVKWISKYSLSQTGKCITSIVQFCTCAVLALYWDSVDLGWAAILLALVMKEEKTWISSALLIGPITRRWYVLLLYL